MKTQIMVISSFLFLLIACTSAKNQNQFINGMIYDFDNEPVSGVAVYINDTLTTYSDIDGHFSIIKSAASVTDYIISCKKKGYETVTLSVTFETGPQLVYFKMYSYEQLLSFAEKLIVDNKLDEAWIQLSKVDEISPNLVTASYLKSIILYKKEEYEEALMMLNAINYSNQYIDRLKSDINQKMQR